MTRTTPEGPPPAGEPPVPSPTARALARLGPREGWGEALAGAVEATLASGPAAALVWGPERLVLPNAGWSRGHGEDGLSSTLSEAVGRAFEGVGTRVPAGDGAPDLQVRPVFGAEGRVEGATIRAEDEGPAPGTAIWTRGTGAWEMRASAEVRDLLGLAPGTDAVPAGDWLRHVRSADHAPLRAALDAAGAGAADRSLTLVVERPGRPPRFCLLDLRSASSSGADRVAGRFRDLTGLAVGLDRERDLQAEMVHRVRNLLARLWAILRRTAETAESLEDAVDHLGGRIGAMARLQSLFPGDPAATVSLETILLEEMREAVAPPGQVRLSGQDVQLPFWTAQPVSLAVHEMMTNAVKFGALSVPRGKVEVTWSRSGDRLSIRWRERGARIEAPPSHRGFGLEMLERALPYELDATVSVRFEEGGFACDIDLPLDHGGPG